MTRPAIQAAAAATRAAGELLRFTAEGPACNLPFANEDAPMRLADALQLALAVEDPYLAVLPDPQWQAQREANTALRTACLAFLGREATPIEGKG